MSKKKPFTEEQEYRIWDITNTQIDYHERHDNSHKNLWLIGLLLFYSLLFTAANVYVIYDHIAKDTQLTTDQIGEMIYQWHAFN